MALAMDASPDDPLEQQQALAETSLALLFSTYDEARSASMADPVVVLLDCEDPIGGQIARAWLGEDAVNDAIGMNDESDTTVFARPFPWKDSQREIPKTFPYLAPVFQSPPPTDGFLVVSVTAGGASALTVPHDARE
jgi:hypothetical protein